MLGWCVLPREWYQDRYPSMGCVEKYDKKKKYENITQRIFKRWCDDVAPLLRV
jgi:hypothetical protein